MISGISGHLEGTDVLGLGKIFGQGAANQEGTAMCGSRPSCFGSGKSCTQKLKTYEDCVQASIAAQRDAAIGVAQAQAAAQARQPQQATIPWKPILIIGGILVAIILITRR